MYSHNLHSVYNIIRDRTNYSTDLIYRIPRRNFNSVSNYAIDFDGDTSFLDMRTTSNENVEDKNVMDTKDITKDLLLECEKPDTCTICLQEECKTKTKCNHYFHNECLENWLKEDKNYSCPNCRKDLFIEKEDK